MVYCCVPLCENTSVKTPTKIFFSMPMDPNRREVWCSMIKRELPSEKSRLYVCEDHFDLENDMENYIRYKLIGGQRKIKQDSFPHIFHCQMPAKATTKAAIRNFNKKQKDIVEKQLKTYVSASMANFEPAMDRRKPIPFYSKLARPVPNPALVYFGEYLWTKSIGNNMEIKVIKEGTVSTIFSHSTNRLRSPALDCCSDDEKVKLYNDLDKEKENEQNPYSTVLSIVMDLEIENDPKPLPTALSNDLDIKIRNGDPNLPLLYENGESDPKGRKPAQA